MPFLVELPEWNLVQELGRVLSSRKARYNLQADGSQEHVTAELFEFRLRRALMVKEAPQNLSGTDFLRCQGELKTLCSLLDGLARHRPEPNVRGYASLQASITCLKSMSGPAVDLANGPNRTLFRLPRDHGRLGACLKLVTACNDTLDRVLAASKPVTTIQPPDRQPNQGARRNDSAEPSHARPGMLV